MKELEIIACTLPGGSDPRIAIAASRAGSIGVLNLEYAADLEGARTALADLVRFGRGSRGVKLGCWLPEPASRLASELPAEIDVVILSAADRTLARELSGLVRADGRRVLFECRSRDEARLAIELGADGLIAKGHEAGGAVSEETTFILLQSFGGEFSVPVWAYGGVGLHTAAACQVAGCAGVVLDWQLALARESVLAPRLRAAIERFEGDETVCLGTEIGDLWRVYKRPGIPAIDELQALESQLLAAPGDSAADWRHAVASRAGGREPALWLVGQDAAFASPFARQFATVAGITAAVKNAARDHIGSAARLRSLDRGAPMALAHGTEFPILQGPMTRVSDTAEFADSIADGGGLPFLALALLRRDQVRTLLEKTQQRLGERPWGVGILGFVPTDLRQEQLEVIRDVRPRFALIAGGRPDQAARLEECGIATYLHVPAPGLLRMFIDDGARRFIFEGRECGGHVGPRTSFVLWDTMVDVLLDAVNSGVPAGQLHVVFAGGIHDARSAAMVASIAAPLAERGARIGVLMGTAYLFTEEAVRAGAIVEQFQQEAIECSRTVLLHTGPGHATRCAETPFCETFRSVRRNLVSEGRTNDEVREELESLNLGRLRIASKGIARGPAQPAVASPQYVEVTSAQQRLEGMYMIGQVAGLRQATCRVAELHQDVGPGSCELIAMRADAGQPAKAEKLQAPRADVAVVGLGCLLPGATDPSSFWANVLGKVDAIREIPADRFDHRLYFDADRKARDKIYSKWGGFIDDVPFDPLAYGIPPTALPSIDPFQLLALQVVDQAIKDAGWASREFPRDRTSVIFGISGGLGDLGCDYSVRAGLPSVLDEVAPEVLDRLPEWTEDSFAGLLLNVAAGRVANRFNLGGLNFTVDAACASSLAAVAIAVRELQAGTSDAVIVGGIDTVQSPFGYLCFSKAQALSPRGRCRTFDENADGIVISEGVVTLVLKRLADAERDGDRIYAVIKSVAGSSDGRGKGLMAPRVDGQMAALERAYEAAQVSAASVGLIEAHGTGTVAGDAAEIEALSKVFAAAGARPASCALGSVKSMIGHTKATAGVAGMLKAILSLHHKVLPPTLNVTSPNPRLKEAGNPFFVNTDPRPWLSTEDGAPRRAGVSSFGFGGTNFHAVLEEYDGRGSGATTSVGSARWPCELLLWTAATPQALAGALGECGARAAEGAELRAIAASVCAAARPGSPDHQIRLAIVASDATDLRRKLEMAGEALRGGRSTVSDPSGVYLTAGDPAGGKIAFLFPGQGSQFPHMLGELALYFVEVRESVELADAVLEEKLPRRLSSYVWPLPAFTDEQRAEQMAAVTDTVVAQPALAAVEIGLFRALAALGVRPNMTAGHSFGEYVALCAAGALSERDLFATAEARGRAIKHAVAETPGGMAAVSAHAGRVADALRGASGIWLANHNAPSQTVIAGRHEDLDSALERLHAAGLQARVLPVACPFHTPLLESARDEFAPVLRKLELSSPLIDVFSNGSGEAYPRQPGAIAAVLVDHIVQPVRFVDEIETMYAGGARIFVEVGPRAVLSGLVRQTLADREALILPLDSSGRSGVVTLLHALAQAAVRGVAIDPRRLFEGRPVETIEAAARPPARRPTWVVSGKRARPITFAPARPLVAPRTIASQSVKSDAAEARAVVPMRPATAAPGSEPPLPVAPPPAAGRSGAQPVAQPTLETRHVSAADPRPDAPAFLAPRTTDAPQGGSFAPAHDIRTDVMFRFQSLMSQFLETQDAVIRTYFQTINGNGNGNGHAAHASHLAAPALPAPALGWPAPAFDAPRAFPAPLAAHAAQPAAAPVAAAPMRSPVVVAAPAVAAPIPVAAPAPVVATPAPAPMASVAAPEPPVARAVADVAAPHGSNGSNGILGQLLKIVSDRTGYPEDMLELDSNIEADLGIDSIKRVEILSAFQRQCSAEERTRMQAAMEKITGLRTLRETAGVLADILGGRHQSEAAVVS